MFSKFAALFIFTALISIPCTAQAESIDEKFKKAEKNPDLKIVVLETTKDQCRNCNDTISIESKSDGKIPLKCAETKYFDVANQDGSWTWHCGGAKERARIANARNIRATRAANGEVTWEWVQIEVK